MQYFKTDPETFWAGDQKQRAIASGKLRGRHLQRGTISEVVKVLRFPRTNKDGPFGERDDAGNDRKQL